MLRNARWVLLPWLMLSIWGCSAPNPNVQVRRMEDGFLQGIGRVFDRELLLLYREKWRMQSV